MTSIYPRRFDRITRALPLSILALHSLDQAQMWSKSLSHPLHKPSLLYHALLAVFAFSGRHLRIWQAVVAIPNLRIPFCNSCDSCCYDTPEAHHVPAMISSSPLIAVARLKASKSPCHVSDCQEYAIFLVKCGAIYRTKVSCKEYFRFLRFSPVVHYFQTPALVRRALTVRLTGLTD